MNWIIGCILVLSLLACKDAVKVQGGDPTKPEDDLSNSCPVSCAGSNSFQGLQSSNDVTDVSAKLNWNTELGAAGYSLFKNQNGKLELIASLGSSSSEYTINSLEPETSYSFLIRSISEEGHLDCNKNYLEVVTTEKNTFTSCKEITDHYLGARPSGYYQIDIDGSGGPELPVDVYCDMTNNSGGWTKILNHEVASGVFSNNQDALLKNIDNPESDLYSILSKLEYFKRDGQFEFWLYYPEIDGQSGGNIWTQSSNPTQGPVANYTAIREDHTSSYWGGLEKSSASTLMDGSVNHGNWWYAVGSRVNYGGPNSIPGPGSLVERVQLFVR